MTDVTGEAPLLDEGAGDDLAALDQAERELGDVDAALERLDAGTYGTCEACGEELDAGRLADEPLLRRCPAHA